MTARSKAPGGLSAVIGTTVTGTPNMARVSVKLLHTDTTRQGLVITGGAKMYKRRGRQIGTKTKRYHEVNNHFLNDVSIDMITLREQTGCSKSMAQEVIDGYAATLKMHRKKHLARMAAIYHFEKGITLPKSIARVSRESGISPTIIKSFLYDLGIRAAATYRSGREFTEMVSRSFNAINTWTPIQKEVKEELQIFVNEMSPHLFEAHKYNPACHPINEIANLNKGFKYRYTNKSDMKHTSTM